MKRLFSILAIVCLISLPMLAQQTGWEIVRADYGSGNTWVDVTDRVRSLVEGDSLAFKVSGSILNADTRRGGNRVLRLQLRDSQGATRQINYRDRQQVNLQVFNSYPDRSSLRINRAIYGSGTRNLDVTGRLNSQMRDGNLNLEVNNQTMGGDPSPGQAKRLTVEYGLNGRSDHIVVNEGDMLRLPYGANANNRGSLQINRATYGSGYRTSDVTSRLNSQMRNGQLELQVNDQTMGGDPSPGQAKRLTVEYALNGRSDHIVVNEGDMLRLPDGDVSSSDTWQNNNNNNRSGLTPRIRCESIQSNNYARKYCPANTRSGVRLARQFGASPCNQDSNWGYDNGGVWVENGCSAEFEMQGSRRTGGIGSTMIPNGTELSVRTNESIDSRNATAGQRFSAMIASDVVDSSGAVTIPRGSDAQLVIRSTSSSNELVLDVDSLTVQGTKYSVSTGDLPQEGRDGVGANQRTAVMVGGGAAIGTLIGAIVGGGKGAAIGAAIGAGAGVGTEVLTKGGQVRVPAETLLSFRLDQDLRLQAMR